MSFFICEIVGIRVKLKQRIMEEGEKTTEDVIPLNYHTVVHSVAAAITAFVKK